MRCEGEQAAALRELAGEGVAGMNELILDLQAEIAEIAAIEAESIGWLPLGNGAYLHLGDMEALVISSLRLASMALVHN